MGQKQFGSLKDAVFIAEVIWMLHMLQHEAGSYHQHCFVFLFQKTRSPDCAPLPSIVICPPTLTGHWMYEVEKFLSRDYLNPLQYIGPPAERDK